MNLGFERKQVGISTRIATHPSVLPAIPPLQARGYQVLLVGPGASDQAEQWAAQGIEVGVGSETETSPAVGVAAPGEDPAWMAKSPHRLTLEGPALAAGQMIGNLAEWVDRFLAPRVPRF